jgi:hypothetical protein
VHCLAHVRVFQIRVGGDNLGLAQAVGDHANHGCHRDSQATHAGDAPHLVRPNGDPCKAHRPSLAREMTIEPPKVSFVGHRLDLLIQLGLGHDQIVPVIKAALFETEGLEPKCELGVLGHHLRETRRGFRRIEPLSLAVGTGDSTGRPDTWWSLPSTPIGLLPLPCAIQQEQGRPGWANTR